MGKKDETAWSPDPNKLGKVVRIALRALMTSRQENSQSKESIPLNYETLNLVEAVVLLNVREREDLAAVGLPPTSHRLVRQYGEGVTPEQHQKGLARYGGADVECPTCVIVFDGLAYGPRCPLCHQQVLAR